VQIVGERGHARLDLGFEEFFARQLVLLRGIRAGLELLRFVFELIEQTHVAISLGWSKRRHRRAKLRLAARKKQVKLRLRAGSTWRDTAGMTH
jgi:hypothetical protein